MTHSASAAFIGPGFSILEDRWFSRPSELNVQIKAGGLAGSHQVPASRKRGATNAVEWDYPHSTATNNRMAWTGCDRESIPAPTGCRNGRNYHKSTSHNAHRLQKRSARYRTMGKARTPRGVGHRLPPEEVRMRLSRSLLHRPGPQPFSRRLPLCFFSLPYETSFHFYGFRSDIFVTPANALTTIRLIRRLSRMNLQGFSSNRVVADPLGGPLANFLRRLRRFSRRFERSKSQVSSHGRPASPRPATTFANRPASASVAELARRGAS